tara:strand:+ start:6480 stop:6647 length:168 start_codon:yes stop_codon:yes gene_type:complete
MIKWNVRYRVTDKNGESLKKTIDVFGVNKFDALATAMRYLKLLERGKTFNILEIN